MSKRSDGDSGERRTFKNEKKSCLEILFEGAEQRNCTLHERVGGKSMII